MFYLFILVLITISLLLVTIKSENKSNVLILTLKPTYTVFFFKDIIDSKWMNYLYLAEYCFNNSIPTSTR